MYNIGDLSKSDLLSLLDTINLCHTSSNLYDSYPKIISSLQKVIPFDYSISVRGYDNIPLHMKNSKDDKFLYTHIDKKNKQKAFEAFNYNYPIDWITTYREKGFYKTDPIMVRNFKDFGLQRWKDTFALYSPPGDFIQIASDIGMTKGYSYGLKESAEASGSLLSIAGDSIEYSQRTDSVIELITPNIDAVCHKIEHAISLNITTREREVIKWLCNGKTSWEISSLFNISERTVNFHIGNIYLKLDVVNRSQAVAMAIRHGIIDIGDIL